jgi:hypothetical protein
MLHQHFYRTTSVRCEMALAELDTEEEWYHARGAVTMVAEWLAARGAPPWDIIGVYETPWEYTLSYLAASNADGVEEWLRQQ